MKLKKEIIVITCSLLAIVVALSYAYFMPKILGTEKEISMSIKNMTITFDNGNESITGSDILPGWNQTSTFTIRNDSNDTLNYDIIIKDFINTFVTEGFLVYKITSLDGGYTMTDFVDVPKSNEKARVTLANNITINGKGVHTYQIEFKYIESTEVDQSEDMGKKLSGKIFISEGNDGSLLSTVLSDNPTKLSRTRDTYSATFEDNKPGTIYRTKNTQDGNLVYYFAGQDTTSTPINNWVKFGTYKTSNIKYRGYYSETNNDFKEYSSLSSCTSASSYNVNCTEVKYYSIGDPMYWRIIRTNENSGIRLIYAGTKVNSENPSIAFSEFNDYSLYTIDESVCSGFSCPRLYNGYMYGTGESLEASRRNENSSNIKSLVDYWYQNNILSNFDNYIDKEAIYCNDKNFESHSDSIDDRGYSTSILREKNGSPTYKCESTGDAFTVSGSQGNNKLTYPIAIVNYDEITFAGGEKSWIYSSGTNNILTDMHVMTPTVSELSSCPSTPTQQKPARPVISLKSCVQWKSGDGSAENPYEIVENGGC